MDLESFLVETLGALSISLFADASMDKFILHQSSQMGESNSNSNSNSDEGGGGGGGGGSSLHLQPHNSTSISTSTLSVCGVYACVVLQNDPSAASELKSFFAASASHHASQTGITLSPFLHVL